MSRNMPMMMKKLLYMDTNTVCISIFNVACLPVMVKNLQYQLILTLFEEKKQKSYLRMMTT